MYDLRKLEAFCRVYELRSFSKAGDALFLSQPTVSAHVQSLEKDVGVRLLDRMGRTVLPTPAGELLYRYCVKAFAELEAADAEIGRLMGEVSGRISLGASTIPSGYLLPQAVTSFLAAYPKVQLDVHVGDSLDVCRRVADGSLMLGVVGAREELPDLLYDVLVEDQLVLVGAPHWVTARYGAAPPAVFSVAEVLAWPWIMREEGSGTRRALRDGILSSGHTLRELHTVLYVDSAQAAMRYAELGLGVTLLSRIMVEEAVAAGKVVTLAVQDMVVQRRFYVVKNGRRETLPALSAFQSHLYAMTEPLRGEHQHGGLAG